MVIALCVDDQYGMLFNSRRQSRDQMLLDRILKLAEGKKLCMSPYSARLFSQLPCNSLVEDEYVQAAGAEDICFVEDEITSIPANCHRLILYHWNRKYPADVRFPVAQLDNWKLVSTADFPGKSHDMITEKIYEKE